MKKYLYLLILIPLISLAVFFILRSLFSSGPIRFPPDTTIVKTEGGDYAYENKTNTFETQFKESPTAKDSIVFQNDLSSISFYTPATQSFGELTQGDSPVADGSTLTYPAIFPGIDLKYTITSSRLLEEFIVKDASTAAQIDRIEQIATTKTIYVENDDGSFSFYNKSKEVFTLPHPVMYETGDPTQKSEGIVYEIKPDGDQLIITKVITEEGLAWLADPKRLYPIAIDLVIDNADALSETTVIDNGDTSSNWTSSDATNTTVSQETTIKQEGTGSVKIQTTAVSAPVTLDLMEYSSNGTAQAGYATSALTSATGGTITTSGGYTIHTFTSSGIFTLSGSGSVEYLVVAGGGGGASSPACSGGGRGGQVSTGSLNLSTGNHTVTVGGGGSGGGGTGGNSVFSSITAAGGTYPSGMGDTLSVPAGGTYSSITGTNTLYGIFGASTTFYGGGWNCSGDSGGPYSGYGTTGVANTGGGGSSGDGKGDCAGVSLSCGGWSGGSGIVIVRYLTPPYLQSYSEATIKTQGTYALKGVANQTTSLNKTLTRTIASPLNLSGQNSVTFDIRASRTGSNIKVGLHDVGGTTTEVTPNITQADTFQSATVDLSGVTNANKDAIDQIIITVVNADAANTFYLDNMVATAPPSLNDTVTRTVSATDLSAATSLTYWVRSSAAGSYATFGFGETAATEQTNTITIAQANTWEQKTWDISGIAAASRNAVTKYAFTFTGNTSGASFYFDDIQAVDPSNTWVSSDATSTTVSEETTIKQEGTGSVKVQTTASGTTTVDLMEYSSDGTAQAGYVSNGQGFSATGGTITTSGGYTIHKFTSSGTFTPTGSGSVEYLIVAGGGSGGADQGGGGGAGGLLAGTTSVTSTAYGITVGAGGAAYIGTSGMGNNGGNSSALGLTAIGGGGGAGCCSGSNGLAGGSGGGGGWNVHSGGAGTAGQGNTGGTSGGNAGGGGGGAGAVGANANAGSQIGGSGGTGVTSGITGVSTYYAGGGGGGGDGGVGSGGAGGGGAGAFSNASSVSGTANTGGGGGGRRYGGSGSGAGGSGIVIVRYLTPPYLQSYSEATIKTQGTYALKGVANQTSSLNKTLTRTIASPLNLSDNSNITFDLRASRTGSNIKVGLHDVGGTTTEVTPNITQADTFQTATIDLSGVTNANKDAIDQIIITIVNADATNTFYLDNMVATAASSFNDTVTRSTAATDLSAVANITYWVRSSVAGSYATFGFGESAATEQTQAITINQANTWEQKSWNIEGITGTARDAVTKYAFTFTGDTSGAAFYFDDIQTNNLFSPTATTPTALSTTSIRWNFTDNSTEETGFRIYNTSDTPVATGSATNLAYIDETGLTTNTQYTRKVGTYNASSTSISTATVALYTLAAVPAIPALSTRVATTININPDPGTNPAGTQMAIYKETGTTCDGVGGSYIAANGSDNGATAVWQTDAQWSTVTATGLSGEQAYSFCIKARNGDNVETAFSPVGSYNAGFIPLSGNYICTQDTVSSNTLTNRYVDGNTPGRYVIALDSGTGSTNNAVFEAKSCIMTLNSTDTLVVGSLELSGGSVAIADGGVIKIKQPVWIIDADADGYSADGKIYYGTQPAGGRRKNLATTLVAGSSDCNDASYNLTNVCCTVATRYQDADGDTYGNPNIFISACPTAGYVDNNTDCYDANTNAKPGSTYCSATNRGDGSYDYNCSGSSTTCGTAYQTVTQTAINVYGCQYDGIDWYFCTGPTTAYYYAFSSTPTCGGSGGVCSANSYYRNRCSETAKIDCSAYWQTDRVLLCSSYTSGTQACQ